MFTGKGTAQEIFQYVKEASDKMTKNSNGAAGVFFMFYKDEDHIINNGHQFDHGLLFNVRELFSKDATDEALKQAKQEFNDILEDLIMNFNEANSVYLGQTKCSCCGEKVNIHFNGKNYIIKEKCEASTIENFSFNIAVPSGELLCGNDFRDLFPDVEHYVNELKGIRDTIDDYCKMGMFHPYVGNSCPFVEKNKETDIIEIGVFDGGDDNNRIETPLWWVSVMDKKLFKVHCKLKGLKIQDTIDELVAFKIKVKPGMYRCTYHYNDDSKVFATLEFISSDIPEDMLNMERIVKTFDKDFYEDCFEDYVNTKYPMIYSDFPTYVHLKIDGSVKRENRKEGKWFPYVFDREKFIKQVDDKYPDLLNKRIDERFLEVKGFGNSVKSFYSKSINSDKTHFFGRVNSFVEAISYDEHYSMWAIASVYLRDVLIHKKFENEEHKDDVKRMFNLCIINLEERGLVEKALVYLKGMENKYNTEPNALEEGVNKKVIESFRKLYQKKYPEKDFDVVKKVLISSL